ncbi:hypothetical protein [Anabaena subtropica]|uniref:Uncharacterized protein n=1 Tax=Anabaena subtropica FACHB-260 TaxID=2692884 RepID=A0ABR8CMT2_9NOST|nr:hypothetical protein [Anabaena subtropica]MBD2343728.1 hypothetical protein [Anabaena subtropica FACHB-260]
MSSGSSGRYQSRFLNFVNQQSRRLTEHWESTFRNFQVTTKWGVEALLYPVYLFLQSADSSVKRLYSKEPPSRKRLQPHNTDLFSQTPLATDRPIQRVLESVQYLPSQETTITVSRKSKFFHVLGFLRPKFLAHRPNQLNSSQSLTIPDKALASVNPSLQQDTLKLNLPIVRGIASNLVNRQLVLVNAENQILDILTPQQQAKLTDRIINEVGEYWHDWQLTQAKEQAHLLPEINQILSRLTGENTSKTAVITDESVKNILNTGKIVSLLDAAIAQLEKTAILPAQQRSLEIMRVAQTQFNIFLYGKEQLNSRGEIVKNAENLPTNKHNFSALIEAALNYFFGVSKNNLLESGFYEQQLLDSSHQSPHEYFTNDPWLDWHDLYDDSKNITEKIRQSSSRIKPSITSSKPSGLLGRKKPTAPQQKPSSSLVRKKKTTSRKVTSAKQLETPISQRHIYPENHVEAQPDWIETTATVLGYEKHLLEYILEWLDRVILGLEQILANIFYFLQGLLQGK